MPRILAISSREISQVLDFDTTIAQVEQGYASLYRGEVQVPQIQHLENAEVQGEIDIKSALTHRPTPYASVKVASGFYQNSSRGLPTGFATILLSSGQTGEPLALMDGDLITNWRTGAAAAVATKHLSRPDSRRVGLIGAGVIARMALHAVAKVRHLDEARVWAPPASMRTEFAGRLSQELGILVRAVGSPQESVQGADIVVTATPSRQPIVMKDMVAPGTHINAMGADGPGKQELDPALVSSSKLVVDRLLQCRVAGELQHPLKMGLMSEEDVYAEIGEVVACYKPGRATRDEITAFDATGVAVQDIVVAALTYELAKQKGYGTWIEI